MIRTLTACLLALWLGACSSQRELAVDPAQANEVMFTAMQQVGKPYRYGGSSPATGFDCSGLVQYVYRQGAGIPLPRTVKEMAAMDAPDIHQSELASGDLLIFKTGWGFSPDHAGIYVGQGRFVHAPSRGGKVRLDRLGDNYWKKAFNTAKRPLAR